MKALCLCPRLTCPHSSGWHYSSSSSLRTLASHIQTWEPFTLPLFLFNLCSSISQPRCHPLWEVFYNSSSPLMYSHGLCHTGMCLQISVLGSPKGQDRDYLVEHCLPSIGPNPYKDSLYILFRWVNEWVGIQRRELDGDLHEGSLAYEWCLHHRETSLLQERLLRRVIRLCLSLWLLIFWKMFSMAPRIPSDSISFATLVVDCWFPTSVLTLLTQIYFPPIISTVSYCYLHIQLQLCSWTPDLYFQLLINTLTGSPIANQVEQVIIFTLIPMPQTELSSPNPELG